MRPNPTHPCAAAHIGQCSPEVKTLALDRSAGLQRPSAPVRILDDASGRPGGAVPILGEDLSVSGDKNRAKRFIACLEGLGRLFDAAAQVL